MAEEWRDGVFTLHFTQVNPPTPGQPQKGAKVLPIAVGLLNPNGDEVVPTTVLEMTEAEQSFAFPGLAARPVASILRGFSAPVVLEREVGPEERAFLLAHDTDPFNRWEAGRGLARDVLLAMVTEGAAPGPAWLEALARVAFDDDRLDPAFRALALRLPGEDELAQALHDRGVVPDPERSMPRGGGRGCAGRAAGAGAGAADRGVARARALQPGCAGGGAAGAADGRTGPADAGGRRAGGGGAHAAADNMTEELGTLAALLDIGQGAEELRRFEARWGANALVMDKWFALQIMLAPPGQAAAVTARLTGHPAFHWQNPNRFRAVIGALSGNHAGFHAADGAGYGLVADWLLKLDPLNPQTAARMSTAFETWPRYDAGRRAKARAALDRILAAPGLSRDLGEMAARLRGG